jgi:hypothetical protein
VDNAAFFRQLSRDVREHRGPCVVCGGEQYVTSVFFPDEEWVDENGGIPPSHIAVVLYSLCESCFQCSDLEDMVERVLLEGGVDFGEHENN